MVHFDSNHINVCLKLLVHRKFNGMCSLRSLIYGRREFCTCVWCFSICMTRRFRKCPTKIGNSFVLMQFDILSFKRVPLFPALSIVIMTSAHCAHRKPPLAFPFFLFMHVPPIPSHHLACIAFLFNPRIEHQKSEESFELIPNLLSTS